jgi:hypothetical protein
VPCATETQGIDNLGPQIGNIAGADAVRARTAIETTIPVDTEKAGADATIVNLRLPNSGSPGISLPGTISSAAAISCLGGVPKVTTSFSTVPITIGGQTIPTDQAVTQVLNGAGSLTGAILSIKPGEVLTGSVGGVTFTSIRGLHLNLHLSNGSVLDVVASESTVSYTGSPCSNSSLPPNGGGSGNGSGSGSGLSGSGSGSSGSGSGSSGSGSGGSGGSGSGSSGSGSSSSTK